MRAPAGGWRFGLVGHPVAHSLSPRLFELIGFAGTYSLHDVAPETLAAWLAGPARTLHGFNVTVPHKTAVAAACSTLTPDARRVGAVNCVRPGPDGELAGTNTDVVGFALALGPAAVEHAVVLGAGGAARAVVEVLLRHGAGRIELVNRTVERAAGLVSERAADERARLRIRPASDIATAFEGADVVVQCTSAALHDAAAFADLPWARTAAGARALELVYRPRETAFVRGALAHGRRAEDGLTMLAGQAVAALEFFTAPESGPNAAPGDEAPLADLAARLADRLRACVD